MLYAPILFVKCVIDNQFSDVRPMPNATQKRTTIYDVAKAAGVSAMTVTRALANKGRVAALTRSKVLNASAALGYRPNMLARSLVKGKTQTIGLVMESLESCTITMLKVSRIEQEVWKLGYRLFIGGHYGEREREEACVQEFLSHRVDGLIVISCGNSTGEFLKEAVASGLPVVTIDSRYPFATWDATIDRQHGAYLQVKHLVDIGRRKLAFLISSLNTTNWTLQARMRGYRQACEDFGLTFDEQLLVSTSRNSSSSLACGTSLVRQALASGEKFDGVVAHNDVIAFGAINGLLKAGLKVPDDVAVIGFDGEPMAADWAIPLSTIQQPLELAKIAVQMLTEQMNAGGNGHPASASQPRRVVVKPRLVVRESTGG